MSETFLKSLLLVLCLVSIHSFSQRKIKKNDIPPGTTLLYDSIFLDQTPISNLSFNEFISSVQSTSKRNFFKLSDSLGNYKIHRTSIISKNHGIASSLEIHFDSLIKSIDKKYFQFLKNSELKLNSNYTKRHYPVLGITKIQANHYCEWRTEVVNLLKRYDRIKNRTGNEKSLKYRYRIPTIKELKLGLFKNGKIKNLNTKSPQINSRSKFLFFNNLKEITNGKDDFQIDSLKKSVTGFRCACEIYY